MGLWYVTLWMTAIAGFHLDAVLIGVLARRAAVLFDLYLGGEHAITEIVGAFNAFVHAAPLPGYGLFSTSPPAICAAWGVTCGQPGGGTAFHSRSNVVEVS